MTTPAPYTLTPSAGNLMRLQITHDCPLADAVRAAGLARSLGAREPRGQVLRFYMTPSVARRWRLLFEGGWSAVRRGNRWGGYSLDSRRHARRRVVSYAQAMELARRKQVVTT